jgi:putative flippase GtrA
MKQFIRFLFAGGIAAGANFGSRFLFSLWVNYEIAIVLAFFVGLLTGFLLMRKLVFNANGKALMPQIVNFVVVNMLALLQTLLISVALVRWLFPEWGIVEQPEAIAHLIGVLAPVVTSYFGHKFLTFR